MGRKARRRLRKLAAEIARAHPHVEDPATYVSELGVLVDGIVVDNPRSLVREGARIELRVSTPLRGEAKLCAALDAFGVEVAGRVALDLGAAAGGFTRALLGAGASRVYAVDAGYGQLLGSLRQDARVVNLERVNLGDLDCELVPDTVEVITMDLSYLAVARAAPQLETLGIAPGADLIALVKPMFELGLAAPPTVPSQLDGAVSLASSGLDASGWEVVSSLRSPVTGARGAIEVLVHARRA